MYTPTQGGNYPPPFSAARLPPRTRSSALSKFADGQRRPRGLLGWPRIRDSYLWTESSGKDAVYRTTVLLTAVHGRFSIEWRTEHVGCRRHRPRLYLPWPRNRFTMKILKYKYAETAFGLEHNRPPLDAAPCYVATISIVRWSRWTSGSDNRIGLHNLRNLGKNALTKSLVNFWTVLKLELNVIIITLRDFY